MLPKIAVAVPSKGALKVLPKIAIGNFSGGRNRQGALEVLPNANEYEGNFSGGRNRRGALEVLPNANEF